MGRAEASRHVARGTSFAPAYARAAGPPVLPSRAGASTLRRFSAGADCTTSLSSEPATLVRLGRTQLDIIPRHTSRTRGSRVQLQPTSLTSGHRTSCAVLVLPPPVSSMRAATHAACLPSAQTWSVTSRTRPAPSARRCGAASLKRCGALPKFAKFPCSGAPQAANMIPRR